jgi:catechol 2,3-dioxygenase-like lactoylglutathione lyase family enzyme
MAIVGLERITYCVDDPELSSRFFEDFGLTISRRDGREIRFDLPDNSRVYIRSLRDDPVAGSRVVGPGVHEVVWGVDTAEHLEALVAGLEADREVTRGEDGVARFVADGGLAMGLRHWPERRAVTASTDPVNSPGNIKRMNMHRRWIARAYPKSLSHVVYVSPDFEASYAFMRDRLGFRLSDKQRDLGFYLRADGTNDHHNLFLLNANAGFPGTDGTLRFHHANFTVTDLDEIMAGKLHMERKGWAKSIWGLGRHRIASALFLYLPCPAGGEAEYGADSDAVDDGWVPRDFDVSFGFAHWLHDMPDWWADGPEWDVTFAEATKPRKGGAAPHPDLPAAQGSAGD